MASSSMENVSFALLESLGDREAVVKDAVITSLRTIGFHQPEMLLSSSHAFLARHQKLTVTHRGLILTVMEKVCESALQKLSPNLIALIINLATQEMTLVKETQDEWQGPASSLLVTLGLEHCNQVMESLLQKFQPGHTPHFYVLNTLGELAVTNPFSFVSFLSDILSRTVPSLHNVKSDSLKYGFALALKRYAEGLCHYVANIDRAPDSTVRKEIYSTQFASVYDVLFNQWLLVRDQKARGAVIECVGTLCQCLSTERMREEVKRLIPVLISMYKKHNDALPVTLGLCRVLEIAVEDSTNPLDMFLEDIWIALFPQAYVEQVDVNKPTTVKNQMEVLRCYQVTVSRYTDKLIYYLLQKLQSAVEKTRIVALVILRHLVNSSSSFIEDKKSVIILALKPVLSDSSHKVKRYVCHLTLALGDHGYLNADNGQLLIEFLVKQLALTDELTRKPSDIDMSHSVLRQQCAQALCTLANNVHQVEHVMWPYIFEFLCTDSYASALSDICRCLLPIAQRMNVENRLTIVYGNGNERLPGPSQILARLITCIGVAGGKWQRAHYALQLMNEMGGFFFPKLTELWPQRLATLQTTLEESKQYNGDKWEIAVIRLISDTLDFIDDDEWACALAAAIGKQIPVCNANLDDKAFMFAALGAVLAHIKNLQFVVDHLDLVFRCINHANMSERTGCAKSLGYCSRVHTDIVLTKLENVAKQEYQKKASGGFFGFIKDNIPVKTESDVEIANLKATVLLSYGYVARNCPVQELTQKLEGTILRFLLLYFENSKEMVVVKQSLMQTTNMIALSVAPSNLLKDYNFAHKPQLLSFIKEYVKAENVDTLSSNLRVLAMSAATSLIKLEPPLTDNDVWSLGTVCTVSVYSLKSVKEDMTSDDVDAAVNQLNCMLEEILIRERTVERLYQLQKLLHPWFSSDSAVERERSIESALKLLKIFLAGNDGLVDFPQIGGLFARFCPRLCDSTMSIRQKCLDCVHWLLAVSKLRSDQNVPVDGLDVMSYSKELEQADWQCQLTVVERLAGVIDTNISPSQMQNYLTVLFDMILDKQAGVSTAASTLLKHALGRNGSSLVAESEKIVTMILVRLTELSSLQTYAECLQALQVFSRFHLIMVCSYLLNQQLPYSQSVCDCWQTLARDKTMLPQALEYLLEILRTEPGYDVVDGNQKVAKLRPLAAVAALSEIIRSGEPEDTIMEFFPRILVGLLIQVGIYSDTIFGRSTQLSLDYYRNSKPAVLSSNALRVFLHRTRSDAILLALNDRNSWSDIEDTIHFSDGIATISKALAAHYPDRMVAVVNLLEPYRIQKADGARIAMYSVLAPVMRFCNSENDELIDTVVALLMGGLADSNIIVRKLCVRGMGNIAQCTDAILSKYLSSVLSAMMVGLEDNLDYKDEIALEAMQGFGKLVVRVPYSCVERIFVNILLRIRPCFEKESGAVRAVAFTLFGHLARFGECEAYIEQIHSNIIALILHANDEVAAVSEACINALAAVGPLTNQPKVEEILKSHFNSGKNRHYSDFLKEVAKTLAYAFGDRMNFYALCCANYVKSASARIRANAALFLGYLLGAAPAELRTTVSKDLIFNGLTLLLKEPETEVRLAAAEALACLHSY